MAAESDEDNNNNRHSQPLLFAEQEQVFAKIELLQCSKDDLSEEAQEIRLIFDKYLECPTLLDPSLPKLVECLSRGYLHRPPNEANGASMLSILYSLSKVRGWKHVVRFLPAHNEHILIVWEALQTSSSWESIYILWHWMSVLSLVPFDVQVMVTEEQTWLSQMFDSARQQCHDAGPTREASAICVASWLSRADVFAMQWPVYEAYAQQTIAQYSSKSHTNALFPLLGVLKVLNTMLKTCRTDREQLVQHFLPFWEPLWNIGEKQKELPLLVTHQLIKWWARMAAAHLPPRIAPWRYQRGKRLLFVSIDTSNEASNNDSVIEERGTLWKVPDLVEDAMGRILFALRNSSTVVRWSAAKGVGRLTERLPALCADDVVDALLETVEEESEDDKVWHGTCLALAELARRGLLLPHRLEKVVPFVIRGIHFDAIPASSSSTATSSVGAHVRDAACYTYWAFGRAFDPIVLRPFLRELNHAAVVTSLLDREVNCRRAASAAFQEVAGRQKGNVPHGIDILTKADFFSLGNRTNSYTKIACSVATYVEYRKPIINHLYREKLFHWDKSIRTLAADTLGRIVTLDASYFCSIVLPDLLANSLDLKNLHVRHGAVIGVAEITLALATNGTLSEISSKHKAALKGLVASIEKKRLYRGRGGEIMRSAVCQLVKCISLSRIDLSLKEQVQLLDSVDACIPHPSGSIQNDACEALHQLMIAYFPVSEHGPSDRLQNRVVGKFIQSCSSSENPAATRGYALALGYLPAKLVAPSDAVLSCVISCLIGSSKYTSLVGSESDAETRRNAIFSLRRIATRALTARDTSETSYPVVCMGVDLVFQVLDAFYLALNDYKTDRRGDVGSWCRMAAIDGIVEVLLLSGDNAKLAGRLSHGHATRLVAAILKQLGEKLDVVRKCAGDGLARILMHEPHITGIDLRSELQNALGVAVTPPNWADSSLAFDRLKNVISLQDVPDLYVDNVLFGLIVSVGGLTETVSKHAFSSLLQWTREGDASRRLKLWELINNLLAQNRGTLRVILPALKSMSKLIARQCFDDIVQRHDTVSTLQVFIDLEGQTSKDMQTLFALVDVSVSLLHSSNASPSTLQQPSLRFLLQMLIHQYPRMRSYAADQLYVFLLEGQLPGGKIATRSLDIVSNTCWATQDVADLKVIVTELHTLLDV
jgi:hypothetical protein